MIRCETINIEGEIREWKWEDKDSLYNDWQHNIDIPTNDDTLYRVWINDEELSIPDGAWFEDLLTMVGINIW